MRRFVDKVALVTGGGGGIGRASALRLGAEGAAVLIADIDADAGTGTEELCRAQGISARFLRTDVTQPDDVEAAVAAALAYRGRIDVLFNCAGGSSPADGPVTTVDLGLWGPTIDSNVTSTVLCCRAAIPHMTGPSAAIVNMASFFALRGGHPLHLYAAAKGALISLTKVLAGQYWAEGIRVNCVAPGAVLTERVATRWNEAQAASLGFDTHPYGVGSPEDVAAIVAFLASDEARMITGATIPAEGGLTSY